MSAHPAGHRRVALWVAVLSLLTCVVSVTQHARVDTPAGSPLAAKYPELFAVLEADINIRPGMTVESVFRLAANSTAASDGPFSPVDDGHSDRHFAYLPFFSEETYDDVPSRIGSLTYLINGSVQCWLDIAIVDGRVENVYVIPGNMTILLPKALWRGSGVHRGRFADLQ